MKRRKLKEKVSFAAHLAFLLDFFNSNEFENQKIEIESWIDLIGASCREILEAQVLVLGTLPTRSETLQFPIFEFIF